MKKISLNGTWKMSGNGYDVEGQVPGSVYSFLHVDNHLLPDPYYRDNELLYLELANYEYTFSKTFGYEPSNTPVFLVFEGLDTLCSVYLNGQKVADTDNMHLRYDFDVRSLLQAGENRLEVVCHSVPLYIKEKDKEAKLFGATDCMAGYPHIRKAHCMMGWDWGARLPDAGIWRSVYLLEKDSSAIQDFRIAQRHEQGRVFLTPEIKTDGEGEVRVTLTSPCGESVSLTPNAETEVQNPQLWWPNGLGEQPLYAVDIELVQAGKTVDSRSIKIGLRELKLIRQKDEFGESFYHEINGLDMFAFGADYIPEDHILSCITPERTRELLEHCKLCNFNAIRVWGGGFYPDDFFFEICDELGLVVFFDLMFACSVYDPDEKMKASIVEEVRQNLTRIRHHACLGLICGNNEIEWHFKEYVAISGRTDTAHLDEVYLELFEKLFPSIVQEVAPDLAYIPSSPTSIGGFADPNGEGYGDCHDWEPDYVTCRNRGYRYLSEFGFQSFPCFKTAAAFTEPGDRNIHSAIMDRHQRSFGGTELILTYLSRNFLMPSDFDTCLYASQLLQAESIRYRVEHYRRLRGRCMGTLYWQLNDTWPVTSWSSIDYCGRYKALQYAAKRFYAPVFISCEEMGDMQTRRFINMQPGNFSEEKSACLCVHNDTREPLLAKVKWWLCGPDSCVFDSGEQEVSVTPLSVKRLDKLEFCGLNSKTAHLSYVLEVNGKVVSEGTALFTPAKYYAFEDPRLSYEMSDGKITVYSKGYAKGVEIEGVDGDLLLSDNYFDMEKGTKEIRILGGRATKLRLRSVYNIR